MKQKRTPPPNYGKGSGSGRRLYNEPTKTITFRVPESKVEQLKELINKKLDGWKIK